MRLLAFILLFTSSPVFAQETKYMGKIKADDHFDCSAYTFINSLYGDWPHIDSVYGIKNICDSKNDIEIRFTACYGPTPSLDIIILSLKENRWTARKFQFYIADYLDLDSARNAMSGKIIVRHLKARDGFDNLFNKLKKNNVFSLPDFSEVKNKYHGPTCGLVYLLTFKAGENFRTYSFKNPGDYILHDTRKVFQNYYSIAEILFKELVKE